MTDWSCRVKNSHVPALGQNLQTVRFELTHLSITEVKNWEIFLKSVALNHSATFAMVLGLKCVIANIHLKLKGFNDCESSSTGIVDHFRQLGWDNGINKQNLKPRQQTLFDTSHTHCPLQATLPLFLLPTQPLNLLQAHWADVIHIWTSGPGWLVAAGDDLDHTDYVLFNLLRASIFVASDNLLPRQV